MSSKAQSWKTIRDQRRKQSFIGRTEQLRAFSDNFVGDEPRYMIFAVTGEGGVGKSTLLKQLETIACSQGIGAAVITCDERQPSPVTAMGRIASELAKYGITHKDFDERHKKYRELRQEIESDPKVPRSAVDLLALGISDLTIKSLRKTPGVGVFFEYADEKAAGEALAQLVNYGITHWSNKDEVQLLREPERVLTPLFLELLVKACDKQQVVLMFDVFERTCDTLSPWLLALVRFEYGDFNTRLTFVISGRDSLEQHWTDLGGDICHISLEPFTPDETRQYLNNREITDDQLVKQIHEDTGGLPVLVELLAATRPQSGMPLPDISKDAVARFLQWTAQEDRRRVALLAAVPRQFNRDIVSAALGGDSTNMFNWLSIQSYIRTSAERGCFYHEKVRELMLRHLRNTTPADLEATYSRLADFFAMAQGQLGLEVKAAYDSSTWLGLERERVYHSISVRPDRDISMATNAFLHALRWRRRAAESIVQACQQVGHETGSTTALEFAAILSDVYTAYDQDKYHVGIDRLGSLEAHGNLTQKALCEIYAVRGWMYAMQEEYGKALQDLDRAITLEKEHSWAIARRAVTYLKMGKYEQALSDFERAIALDEKDAWTIAWRGGVYLEMNKYEQALADFERAFALDRKYAWAIAMHGLTCRQMGKYEEAIADFDRAIEFNEKFDSAIGLRGLTHLRMGKYEQAVSDFDRVITLDEKNISAISGRGEAYLRMGKYEEAIADFDRAIALDEKDVAALANRGETYRHMGKYEQALADFDRAIALDEKNASAHAVCGIIHLGMGRYDEALADFDRAIALDEDYAWAIANRGVVYGLIAKYEQALADFDRAIALNEKDKDAIANRGETYRRLGNNDSAIKDFTLALELDPKDSYCLHRRAAIYLSVGNTEAARADLARAMTLPLKNAFDFRDRAVALVLLNKEDEAIKMLREALECDPSVRTFVQTDDLLDPISSLPEFQMLIANPRAA